MDVPQNGENKMIEIDETKLPAELLVEVDGKKTIDFAKIKTQSDVDNVLNSKNHVKSELNSLKEKFKDVDIERYQALLAAELDQNKDILKNPLYLNLENKFNALTQQYQGLQSEITKRDEAIVDNELKDFLRANKELQISAIDDIFNRCKLAGFKKTEKGFLDAAGKTVDSFVDGLKTSAPHLFKQTNSAQFNTEAIKNGLKNNDLQSIFASLNVKN